MAYPDRLLADDEEVVLDLRPHWKVLIVPVVVLLIVCAVTGFGLAVLPDGDYRDLARIAVVVVAVLLLAAFVVVPVLRWRTTRFIVTSLKRREIDARVLYERVYCARGDMENRVKECQLDLFAGRASAATMRANQLRLWFASMAYVLLCALRRIGLAHTQFAEATCGTLRLALLRIGAQARRSVRRIKIAMASAHPYQNEFALAHARLSAAAAT